MLPTKCKRLVDRLGLVGGPNLKQTLADANALLGRVPPPGTNLPAMAAALEEDFCKLDQVCQALGLDAAPVAVQLGEANSLMAMTVAGSLHMQLHALWLATCKGAADEAPAVLLQGGAGPSVAGEAPAPALLQPTAAAGGSHELSDGDFESALVAATSAVEARRDEERVKSSPEEQLRCKLDPCVEAKLREAELGMQAQCGVGWLASHGHLSPLVNLQQTQGVEHTKCVLQALCRAVSANKIKPTLGNPNQFFGWHIKHAISNTPSPTAAVPSAAPSAPPSAGAAATAAPTIDAPRLRASLRSAREQLRLPPHERTGEWRLNAAQYDAAVAPDSALVVVSAGPGTGKTETTVARFMHLLANEVPLEKIRVISFTKVAATEVSRAHRAAAEHRRSRPAATQPPPALLPLPALALPPLALPPPPACCFRSHCRPPPPTRRSWRRASARSSAWPASSRTSRPSTSWRCGCCGSATRTSKLRASPTPKALLCACCASKRTGASHPRRASRVAFLSAPTLATAGRTSSSGSCARRFCRSSTIGR